MPSFEDLHLKPPIGAALERLGWSPDDPYAREAAPTAARGHNLVAVTPPIPAYAAPAVAGLLSRIGGGIRGLVLCPAAQEDEWGRLMHRLGGDLGLRVQVANGTARVTRRLKADAVDAMIASPETALALVSRSTLRMNTIGGILLAWPETWPHDETLTPLMQDLPKDTQRIIYTAEGERVNALLERYARKALTIGAPEGSMQGPVRTVSVPWSRRVQTIAELIELLDPASLVIWTVDRSYHAAIHQTVALQAPEAQVVTGDVPPAGTIIAFDLPNAERLRQLCAAGEVILMVPPGAESYAARIAAPRRPLQLPGAVDAARTQEAARRNAVVKAIEAGEWNRSLLALAPLFERHDPVVVAAALFELWSRSATGPPAPQPADIPATSKIYVSVGKKDGVTASDLVGVMTKELGVERGKIGRIELRETYSLVETPALEAEKMAAALNGVTLRRKRVTARVDRGPTLRRTSASDSRGPGGRGSPERQGRSRP